MGSQDSNERILLDKHLRPRYTALMDITIGYYKERETRYQDGGADPKLIAAAQEALAGAFEAYREDWSGIEVKGALDGAALSIEQVDLIKWNGMELTLTYGEQEEVAERLRACGAFESVVRVKENNELVIDAICAGAPYDIKVGPGEKDGEVKVDISAWLTR